MPFAQAGDVRLHYVEHGTGERTVVFVHGNLGCVEWMELVLPLLPTDLRVIAYDWRGCGESDKPAPSAGYGNYSMATHAGDLLKLLGALGIEHCDLANHSTGAIICDHALLAAPERFGRVLSLDPVAPRSISFDEQALGLFGAMKADRNVAFAALATAAPTLFRPDTLAPGKLPLFRDDTRPEQRQLFQKLVARTAVLSDGVWFGTPTQLTAEATSGELAARQRELAHPRLILWGEHDYWIPREHMEELAAALPHCRLERIPHVGHAMNIEDPQGFAQRFTGFFTNC